MYSEEIDTHHAHCTVALINWTVLDKNMAHQHFRHELKHRAINTKRRQTICLYFYYFLPRTTSGAPGQKHLCLGVVLQWTKGLHPAHRGWEVDCMGQGTCTARLGVSHTLCMRINLISFDL